jgi:hypothetical protein
VKGDMAQQSRRQAEDSVMADRWMDERDREWRDRDWRRSEEAERATRRWGEDRTWSGAADDDRGSYEDQDRNWRDYDEDQRYGEGARDHDERYLTGRSPRFGNQDYTARSHGGYAGEVDYGLRSAGGPGRWSHDGDRSYNRELERRHAAEMRHPASGGTGGYDYERGYGDGGRGESRETGRGEGAGDFFSRAGERISSWFRGGSSHDDEERRPRRLSEDFGREARPIPDRGHKGLGPRGYKRSDERISDEVHDRLTDDPWLDASGVEVQVVSGEVTLSGFVDNREAKHRAERVIEDISGVGHVQNNLRVDPDRLTGAGRGYGSSALEAEMRRNAQANDPGNNGASGRSGRTSTGAAAERSAESD